MPGPTEFLSQSDRCYLSEGQAPALQGVGSRLGNRTPRVLAPEQARALTAHGGPHGRLDGDTETFIPFDTTQITSDKNYSEPKPGDPCHPLAKGAHPPAIAFSWQQGDDSPFTGTGRGRSWVARAGDYTGSLSTTRHDAVAFNHIQDPVSSSEAVPTLGEEGQAVAATLSGGGHPNSNAPGRRKEDDENLAVAGAAVRRLTPTECERLQGFPDSWTCLCGVEPYSTAACRCPDGPRYAALGNAVTVPVVAWIGRRLRAVHAKEGA